MKQSFTIQGQYVAQLTNKNCDPLKYKCLICNQGEHGIYYCQRFLEMTPQVKRNTLRKLNICQNCLYNHNGNGCISSKRCRKCNDNHNTLLHEAFVRVSHNTPDVDSARNSTANQPSRRLTKTESSQLARGNSHVSFQNNIPEVLLPTAIIKVQAADGSFQTLRALLDQGSQTSIISENAAQLLGLPRKRCPGVICGIGQKDSNCKGEITIKCQAISSNYEFYTDVLIMNKLIRNLPNHTFSKPSWSYLDSITLADPNFNISRPVDILLGSSIYSKVLLEGLCRAEEYSASAQNTRLGWILSGDVTHSYQCNVVLHNLEEIQKFWEIEDITEESPFSSGDQQCIDYYKSTTTRLEDGRYQVRLPLKNIFENVLGSSKPKAIAQFKSLERKFTQNPDIEREYKRFMTEYQELGHMTLARKNYNPECFLTHHSVQNVESSSSKFRVVFNASAKTSSGYSLNDIMETGPNLQQDLQSLIIKWRLYKYAFTADIEKMFRQILIHEQDQQLQKIIWRNSPQDPLCEYQLATVTYGTKAAPFLAMMTLRQLAEDECSKYPDSQAGKVIEEQFYMDDLLSGSHDLQSAKQLQSDLIQLLKSAGMNLRKWSSNYSELLINVDSEKQTNEVFNFKYQESTKTLGLNWKPKTDQFTFLPILCTSTKKQTKRTLLSEISKLFDPLGWLTPISTKIKILFQKVWLANLQWDDQLPTDLNNEWNIIKTDLVNIKLFQIPRWLHCNKHDTLELHGFCDASMKAYACVIYCKIIRTDKYGHASISITMVAAKSRIVPPNKTITLPRLELSAAHLLAKLMKKVNSCLSEHNVVLYGWSDSTAVLGWLQGDTDRWKLFVANRVKEIVKTLPPNSWRYVKSNENPADCASRGLSAELLLHQSSWWNGPKWLPTFKKSTIENQHVYITSEDIKKSKQINVTTYPYKDILSDLINKHSSFTRVTRVLAWILRVKYRSKQSFLSVDELRRTKMSIIKHIQSIEFKKEVERLQNKKDLHVKSKILNLNPFLDSEGMLRVGGRLKFAHIDKNKIHPLIIPHDCHLTDLLIDHAHKMVFHGGPRITLAWLRQHYWIIGGNRAVKKRLRQCIRCRKCSPTYQNQVMGNLPESRVNPTRPFFKTGVDFTGYVEVKASKGRTIRSTKGYIAVFVCMATKAIHLELVSDLSSSSFLAALRRMAARRGTPRHLYSDNGTNFVGANNVLQHEIIELKNIINEEFLSHVSEMEIEWHFNSPSWPSAGGLWEAAVKSLKYHLRRVIGEQKLTFEEYATVLAQLEACLNSRPLCALTEDPEDIDYLTPSHFLSSGPTLTIIETERDKRTRWQLTQKIFQDTWKRWQTEYLCQLTARSKWLRAQPNLNINDIVIIHDANLPAGKWPMGRILEIHPGKDGYVRVVTVKTKNGVIKRPITKLSILPVHHNKSDKDVPASKSCTETS